MSAGFLSDKPEFVDWVRKAHGFISVDQPEGFRIEHQEAAYDVWMPAPEQVWLRRLVRGRDRGIEFHSPRWVDVEKYLSFILGSSVRHRAGLPPLRLYPVPFDRKYLAPDFELDGSQMPVTLRWTDGEGTHIVSHLWDHDAVAFSLYQHLTASELRAALQDPQGSPLSS